MPQTKEVHREYMRNRRKGSQQGSQVTLDTKKAAKLLMICKSLDKETIGLDGKRVNLLTMVRYGVEGPTFKEVRDRLS